LIEIAEDEPVCACAGADSAHSNAAAARMRREIILNFP
jgi:hypothetical protein